MNRRDVIEAFARRRGDAPVIIGPGVSSRMLYETEHRPATIYQMELGYAVPMCLGLAFALPDQRVWALDGDGSLLMSLSVLTTIARYRPPNLGVLVLDTIGFATEHASGTYSRGARGFFIEGGELAHPIDEFTIAGRYTEMLAGVDALANDLRFDASVVAPSFRIAEMTVSGS